MELNVAPVALSACATSDPAELERIWSRAKVRVLNGAGAIAMTMRSLASCV